MGNVMPCDTCRAGDACRHAHGYEDLSAASRQRHFLPGQSVESGEAQGLQVQSGSQAKGSQQLPSTTAPTLGPTGVSRVTGSSPAGSPSRPARIFDGSSKVAPRDVRSGTEASAMERRGSLLGYCPSVVAPKAGRILTAQVSAVGGGHVHGTSRQVPLIAGPHVASVVVAGAIADRAAAGVVGAQDPGPSSRHGLAYYGRRPARPGGEREVRGASAVAGSLEGTATHVPRQTPSTGVFGQRLSSSLVGTSEYLISAKMTAESQEIAPIQAAPQRKPGFPPPRSFEQGRADQRAGGVLGPAGLTFRPLTKYSRRGSAPTGQEQYGGSFRAGVSGATDVRAGVLESPSTYWPPHRRPGAGGEEEEGGRQRSSTEGVESRYVRSRPDAPSCRVPSPSWQIPPSSPHREPDASQAQARGRGASRAVRGMSADVFLGGRRGRGRRIQSLRGETLSSPRSPQAEQGPHSVYAGGSYVVRRRSTVGSVSSPFEHDIPSSSALSPHVGSLGRYYGEICPFAGDTPVSCRVSSSPQPKTEAAVRVDLGAAAVPFTEARVARLMRTGGGISLSSESGETLQSLIQESPRGTGPPRSSLVDRGSQKGRWSSPRLREEADVLRGVRAASQRRTDIHHTQSQREPCSPGGAKQVEQQKGGRKANGGPRVLRTGHPRPRTVAQAGITRSARPGEESPVMQKGSTGALEGERGSAETVGQCGVGVGWNIERPGGRRYPKSKAREKGERQGLAQQGQPGSGHSQETGMLARSRGVEAVGGIPLVSAPGCESEQVGGELPVLPPASQSHYVPGDPRTGQESEGVFPAAGTPGVVSYEQIDILRTAGVLAAVSGLPSEQLRSVSRRDPKTGSPSSYFTDPSYDYRVIASAYAERERRQQMEAYGHYHLYYHQASALAGMTEATAAGSHPGLFAVESPALAAGVGYEQGEAQLSFESAHLQGAAAAAGAAAASPSEESPGQYYAVSALQPSVVGYGPEAMIIPPTFGPEETPSFGVGTPIHPSVPGGYPFTAAVERTMAENLMLYAGERGTRGLAEQRSREASCPWVVLQHPPGAVEEVETLGPECVSLSSTLGGEIPHSPPPPQPGHIGIVPTEKGIEQFPQEASDVGEGEPEPFQLPPVSRIHSAPPTFPSLSGEKEVQESSTIICPRDAGGEKGCCLTSERRRQEGACCGEDRGSGCCGAPSSSCEGGACHGCESGAEGVLRCQPCVSRHCCGPTVSSCAADLQAKPRPNGSEDGRGCPFYVGVGHRDSSRHSPSDTRPGHRSQSRTFNEDGPEPVENADENADRRKRRGAKARSREHREPHARTDTKVQSEAGAGRTSSLPTTVQRVDEKRLAFSKSCPKAGLKSRVSVSEVECGEAKGRPGESSSCRSPRLPRQAVSERRRRGGETAEDRISTACRPEQHHPESADAKISKGTGGTAEEESLGAPPVCHHHHHRGDGSQRLLETASTKFESSGSHSSSRTRQRRQRRGGRRAHARGQRHPRGRTDCSDLYHDALNTKDTDGNASTARIGGAPRDGSGEDTLKEQAGSGTAGTPTHKGREGTALCPPPFVFTEAQLLEQCVPDTGTETDETPQGCGKGSVDRCLSTPALLGEPSFEMSDGEVVYGPGSAEGRDRLATDEPAAPGHGEVTMFVREGAGVYPCATRCFPPVVCATPKPPAATTTTTAAADTNADTSTDASTEVYGDNSGAGGGGRYWMMVVGPLSSPPFFGVLPLVPSPVVYQPAPVLLSADSWYVLRGGAGASDDCQGPVARRSDGLLYVPASAGYGALSYFRSFVDRTPCASGGRLTANERMLPQESSWMANPADIIFA